MPSISIFMTIHAMDTKLKQDWRDLQRHTPAATAFMSSAKVITCKYEIIASKALQCDR